MCKIILALVFSLHAVGPASDVRQGHTFTVSAYLFNDSGAAQAGALTVSAPTGLEPLTPQVVSGVIPPGRALRLDVVYRADVKGLHTILVRGGGQIRRVVVRVGPIEAKAAIRHMYFPLFRA